MILIAIKVKILPNKFKELRQTLDALLARVSKEKGFLNSYIYKDTENDNFFCIMQKWKTQGDLDVYMNSENHKILLGAIRLLAESSQFKITTFLLATESEVLIS
jgi:quinol monooxygenase YgiN